MLRFDWRTSQIFNESISLRQEARSIAAQLAALPMPSEVAKNSIAKLPHKTQHSSGLFVVSSWIIYSTITTLKPENLHFWLFS